MDRIVYSQEKMDLIKNKVQKMLGIVTELEAEFPGRHFTLDGHLVGSVGEVLAAYYYGIELYKASTKVHDGCIDDREVQIKITQKGHKECEKMTENITVNEQNSIQIRRKEGLISCSVKKNHSIVPGRATYCLTIWSGTSRSGMRWEVLGLLI